MKRFEALDVSGDVGLKVRGKNPGELFENAAAGLYSLITDPALIKEKKTVAVEVKSSSLESLFVSWLNELVFHSDARGFMGKRIEIMSLELGAHGTEYYMLKAKIHGEVFDPERHESRLLIKAATYHQLKIEEKDNKWEATVIFDI